MVQSVSGKPEDPRSVPMIHVDKKLNAVGCVCLEPTLRGGKQEDLRAFWPATVAEAVNSRFCELSMSKYKVEGD